MSADLSNIEPERKMRSSELAMRESQLEHESAEIDRIEEDLAMERVKWQHEWQVRETALAQRAESLEQRMAEVKAESLRVAEQKAELERQRRELEGLSARIARLESAGAPASPSISPTPTIEEPPTDVDRQRGEQEDDAVFARLRALSLLKEAGATGEESPGQESAEKSAESRPNEWEVSDQPVARIQRQQAAPPSASSDAEQEDNSINDYMAKLLQRMRGDSDEGAQPVRHVVPEPRETPTTAQQPAAASSETQDSVQPPPPAARLAKLEPRRAPDKALDLAALREIANATSRTAIASHHQRRRATYAVGKLGKGIAGVVATVLFFVFLPSHPLLLYAGLAILVVSVFWLAQACVAARHVHSGQRKRQDCTAAASGDETPEPEITQTSAADAAKS